MRTVLRRFLDIVRWPLGALTLLGLPSAFRTIAAALAPMLHEDHLAFWAGLLAVLTLWFWRWRTARWGRFITTIEHESLHALIGMLTLIPVRELKVREDGSGHVLFEPPGHWLLYLAPYFVPLLLLIEIGLVRLLQLPVAAESTVLGAVLALSLLGHLRQIHPRQTDFRYAGRVFTVAFLPTAILLCYGAAFTMLRGGTPHSVMQLLYLWLDGLWWDTQWAWDQLMAIRT